MKLTLLEKKPETLDVVSFIFKPEEPATWKAGQFFHYVLHHRPTDERGSDRWFTISAAPYEDHVQITTRFTPEKSSTFKNALKYLKEGDTIEISDLDGDFTLEDISKNYVFIAGGIGITPFRSILKQLEHEGKKIKATLLYANRDENIVFKKELEEIAAQNPDFSIHYIISPEHIDEEKIKSLVSNLTDSIFYISGPEPMVDGLGNTLKTMGILDNNIKQDWFPGYPEE